MENIKNLEIINISEKDGVQIALISYQDTSKTECINNGYNTIDVPINLREIQYSIRGNQLVNQSLKEELLCSSN